MSPPPLDSVAFLDLPALAPPPGVTPNFKHPSNLSAPELGAVQLTVATLVVAMRLYTKRCIVKKMLAEDWWLLAAWLCFVCFHVNVFLSDALPLGVHEWDLTIRSAIRHAKLFQISTGVYAVVALTLKVAIILQIRRIVLLRQELQLEASRSRRVLQWVIDFFVALNVVFYATLIVFQFCACRPLRKAWDFRQPGYCVPRRLSVHIASASINTASDLICIILPQPVIWGLRMATRRKWGLSAVFMLGGLACITSAVRLYYAVLLFRAADMTYAAGKMSKWVEPELTFGFLAACLPVLPTFVKHVARTALGRKVQRLWTSRPIEETGQSSSRRHVDTYGSSGITKKVEMDVEFAELTKKTTGSQEERENSDTGPDKEMSSRDYRWEDWHDDAGVQAPRPTHSLRCV